MQKRVDVGRHLDKKVKGSREMRRDPKRKMHGCVPRTEPGGGQCTGQVAGLPLGDGGPRAPPSPVLPLSPQHQLHVTL